MGKEENFLFKLLKMMLIINEKFFCKINLILIFYKNT